MWPDFNHANTMYQVMCQNARLVLIILSYDPLLALFPFSQEKILSDTLQSSRLHRSYVHPPPPNQRLGRSYASDHDSSDKADTTSLLTYNELASMIFLL